MLDVIRRKSRSFGVKIIFGLIIIVFVFWGASGVNTNSPATFARVNGVPINASDVMREYNSLIQRFGGGQSQAALGDEQKEGVAQLALQRLVTTEIIRQEAERLGMEVSDIELSILINQTPEFQGPDGKFDHEVYKETLARVRMTRGMYERGLSGDIMNLRLQSYVTAAVDVTPAMARQSFNFEFERRSVDYLLFPSSEFAAQVEVKEADIAEYYEGNKSYFAVPAMANVDYLLFTPEALAAGLSFNEDELKAYYNSRLDYFEIPARYLVRHILVAVPPSADEAKVAEAKAKAEQALTELESGKSFAAVAKSFSEDSLSRDNGGKLDWLSMGQADPAFEAEVKALKPGETGQVTRTALGFQIVRLEEFEAASLRPFAEVRDEVEQMKRDDDAYRGLESAMLAVEDDLTGRKPFEDIAAQYGIAAQTSGLLEMEALVARLNVKAAALGNIGAVKPGACLPLPVEVTDGFMVVRVNEYQPAYTQPLEEVRESIVGMLRERDSLALAMQTADQAAVEIAAAGGELPAKYASRLEHSPLVDRSSGLAALGFSPILTQSVFSAQPGQWGASAYSTENGATLIKVSTVVPPTESDWNLMGERYTAQLLEMRKRDLFNAYLGRLAADSEVEILVDRILKPSRES